MHPTALRLITAGLFAILAIGIAERGVAQTAPAPVDLRAAQEKRVAFDAEPNDVTGYWGELQDNAGKKVGSYRGTCVWLGQQGEDRVTCNIVLAFEDAANSTLIAEGLIKQPVQGLFAAKYGRRLAVTGGAGRYEGRRGSAQLAGGRQLKITFVP